MPWTEQEREIVERLADGEDPWVIDPEYGCTNPLTGYFPSAEVAEEKQRRIKNRGSIVSALGREYPMSMMGLQAADWDAAILAERKRMKSRRERLWRKLTMWELRLLGPSEPGVGTRLVLQATCLILVRTERTSNGGLRTWYPLHLRWAWSRRYPPHLRIRLNAGEL